MNYRQWKKDYKKKHGYNPSLMDDKRKRIKAMRMLLRKCNVDVEDFANRITECLSRAFGILGDIFNKASDSLKKL